MEYKVGDIVKYRTRTYGYFYGESNKKRMVVSIRYGVIKKVIKHNNRVSYYSIEMIQVTHPRVIKLKGVIDSVYPDEIEGEVNDNSRNYFGMGFI